MIKIRLKSILTKEFLYKEHIVNKKSLNKISKEVGCDHKSVANYLNIHKLDHLKPYHGLKNQEHKGWRGYKEISRTYWNSVKTGARNRNIPFNIKIEQVWNLYVKQNKKCKLSGLDIGFIASKDNTASLDRIDSSKGYEINNVQWVHKDLNTMKWDLPQEKFIEMCKHVAEYQINENN
jgi:uncharacterized protein (DUF983 family)